jgi:hypothetical protein
MTVTLNDLLRATSRSFWLTLRVLPAAVRPQIGFACLFACNTSFARRHKQGLDYVR